MERPNFISVDNHLININAIVSTRKIVDVVGFTVREITIDLMNGRSIILKGEDAQMVDSILEEYALNTL